jgi:hypothetical protein
MAGLRDERICEANVNLRVAVRQITKRRLGLRDNVDSDGDYIMIASLDDGRRYDRKVRQVAGMDGSGRG